MRGADRPLIRTINGREGKGLELVQLVHLPLDPTPRIRDLCVQIVAAWRPAKKGMAAAGIADQDSRIIPTARNQLYVDRATGRFLGRRLQQISLLKGLGCRLD